MYYARDLVSLTRAARRKEGEMKDLQGDAESIKLWAENWYDGLTYCKYLMQA